MYDKILIPLDSSELSQAILPYAYALAKSSHIPIELLHVVHPDTIEAYAKPSEGRFYDQVEGTLRANGRAYLESVLSRLPGSADVTLTVEIGLPAEVIVKRAEAQPGTLTAMATHARYGIQRWFLGSVAEKVLHLTKTPLLLIGVTQEGAAAAAELKTIIVPLDGSELSEKALPYAVTLAKKAGLKIILVRAYALPAQGLIQGEYSFDTRELTNELKQQAEHYLHQKARQLFAEGLEKVSTVSLAGNAASEIIDFGRKTPNALIVMTTHGRSGLAQWMLGSVAGRVVRLSGYPVLLIRPEDSIKAEWMPNETNHALNGDARF